MAYSVIDTKDFEGRRKPVAQALGAAAIRANQFDSQPDKAGHAHDEVRSGQEELYVPLRGTGRLVIDDETVELAPGRYVLVGPGAQRQVIAGPEGLSYLVVGARVADEEG
jgi:quercetin dioxygenase-like cupin family protein